MLDQIFILSTYLRKIENKETKLIADILEKLSNNINILGMDLIRSLQGIVRGSSESTEARSILNLIMKFLNSLIGEEIDEKKIAHIKELVDLIKDKMQNDHTSK